MKKLFSPNSHYNTEYPPRTVHEIRSQFKCSLCDLSSDTKTEVEEHFATDHPKAQFCMIREGEDLIQCSLNSDRMGEKCIN